MLSKILELLETHKAMTPEQIARALDASPAAVDGMLQTLSERGLIEQAQGAQCAVSCTNCKQPDGSADCGTTTPSVSLDTLQPGMTGEGKPR